jgi:hypothetical protein
LTAEAEYTATTTTCPKIYFRALKSAWKEHEAVKNYTLAEHELII